MMNPRVKTVTPLDSRKLELTFTNGEVGIYDCIPLLDFGVFTELRDVNYFNRARVEGGTVDWPNEQDICPDTLYENSKKLGGAIGSSLNASRQTLARMCRCRSGKIAKEFSSDLATHYPNLNDWVFHRGWIEIGEQHFGQAFAYAHDEGGQAWEGKRKYDTLEEVLEALDKGIGMWLEKYG